MNPRDSELNFIDPAVLFREPTVRQEGRTPQPDVDFQDEAGSIPKITSLPEGIEVIEQRVGRAVGNWILQVRCQCGRRWFETEPMDATNCPRCGMYVYIDVQAGSGPES